MDHLWGITATEWTAIGTVASVVGVIVTIVIAIIVQNASRRSAQASQQVVQSLEDLVRRSRRDDLLQQLRTENDSDRLDDLIDEGRMLAGPEDGIRLILEKAYYSNPSTPIPGSYYLFLRGMSEKSKKEIINAIIDSLPDRFTNPAWNYRSFIDDVRSLTHLAIDVDVRGRYKIAQFVIDQGRNGWKIEDTSIREVLFSRQVSSGVSNIEAASDYLYELQHREIPGPLLVNSVAGVSLAVLDYRLLYPGAPFPSDICTAYIQLMQRNLAEFGDLEDSSEMSICIDHAMAVTVDAIGLVSNSDKHLNMRALQSLNPILRSFSTSMFPPCAITTERFASGIQNLLKTNAPEHLRTELKRQAVRLAPSIRDAMPQ